MDDRLRARNRFGLGARVGEPRDGADLDPRGWLRAQLEPDKALLPAGTDAADMARIAAVLSRLREGRSSRDEEERRAMRRTLRELVLRERTVALEQRVRTDAPFAERLVAFWSNHLCVSSARSPAVAALAGHYERTVIRPHALGRFEAMLLASARHPAMLLYLDNARSVGPESPAGRASARRGAVRGLNENYARELLELHTVSVEGGYEQADVEAAARILTGWTIHPGREVSGRRFGGERSPGRRGPDGRRRPRPPLGGGSDTPEPLAFVFRRQRHEPGAKRVMGRAYGPGGADEGEALIRDLAAHPSTATFVATKLARHFVSDEPPPSAVARLAGVYLDTDGDLREVSRALVDLEEAWHPTNRKLRRPQEWLVAALRALRAERVPPPLLAVLGELRHPLWDPPSPEGFDDVMRPWADPDSLLNRAELARSVARRTVDGRPDPRRLLEVIESDDGGALAAMLGDASIPVDERFALALGGPAFQWR